MTSKLALNKTQLYTLARQNSKCSFAMQDARQALSGILAAEGKDISNSGSDPAGFFGHSKKGENKG